MAIILDVPEDFRNIEPKIVGNFTARQLLWGSVAGACLYAAYAFQKKFMGVESIEDANVLIMMLSIGFPAFMAIGKIRKLPPEKFVKIAFTSLFLQPRLRKYEIENDLKKEIKFQKELQKLEMEEQMKKNMSNKDWRKYQADMKKERRLERREDARKVKQYRKEYGPLA